MTAEQALDLCKSKDSSEKLFRGEQVLRRFQEGQENASGRPEYIKGKADI